MCHVNAPEGATRHANPQFRVKHITRTHGPDFSEYMYNYPQRYSLCIAFNDMHNRKALLLSISILDKPLLLHRGLSHLMHLSLSCRITIILNLQNHSFVFKSSWFQHECNVITSGCYFFCCCKNENASFYKSAITVMKFYEIPHIFYKTFFFQ